MPQNLRHVYKHIQLLGRYIVGCQEGNTFKHFFNFGHGMQYRGCQANQMLPPIGYPFLGVNQLLSLQFKNDVAYPPFIYLQQFRQFVLADGLLLVGQ
ncbi:hypothetical protein [uncultured Mucilaginibacter sp.]|uniref:hypothetical protein n=1 Tax=uncultured Mucilaginibacter sp. TaxID=797541 RepID=UPI0025E0EB80|nr:hypothetical protein [uncultured Mucilaginibacter sp.]